MKKKTSRNGDGNELDIANGTIVFPISDSRLTMQNEDIIL